MDVDDFKQIFNVYFSFMSRLLGMIHHLQGPSPYGMGLLLHSLPEPDCPVTKVLIATSICNPEHKAIQFPKYKPERIAEEPVLGRIEHV